MKRGNVVAWCLFILDDARGEEIDILPQGSIEGWQVPWNLSYWQEEGKILYIYKLLVL